MPIRTISSPACKRPTDWLRAMTLEPLSFDGSPAVTVEDEHRATDEPRPWHKVAPLHRRQVAMLAGAYVVLTAIYTGIGFAITEWWEPSAAGAREADFNVWLEGRRTESRNTLAEWGAALSNTETKIGLCLALLPLMLWMYRRWHDWAFLVVALLFEVSVFGTSSKIVVRDRPPVEQLDGAPTNSWPSGHVAAACVFYVGLAMVVYWNTRSRLSRTVFTVIAVLAPIVVAIARLYQGMHYLTDVAGGVVLAAITLPLVRALMIHAGQDPRLTQRLVPHTGRPGR
jgi:membrane-associated phospholipid phosphatase